MGDENNQNENQENKQENEHVEKKEENKHVENQSENKQEKKEEGTPEWVNSLTSKLDEIKNSLAPQEKKQTESVPTPEPPPQKEEPVEDVEEPEPKSKGKNFLDWLL